MPLEIVDIVKHMPAEESSQFILKIAKKFFNVSSVVDSVLLPVFGSYLGHIGAHRKFVGFKRILKTHVIVFRRCMNLSNNFSMALFTSCSVTTVVCVGLFLPGPQQLVTLPLCESLILLVEEYV
jgi:hypothetical protein